MTQNILFELIKNRSIIAASSKMTGSALAEVGPAMKYTPTLHGRASVGRTCRSFRRTNSFSPFLFVRINSNPNPNTNQYFECIALTMNVLK